MAEEARWQCAAQGSFAVTALLDARMDEMYAGSFQFDRGLWRQDGQCSLIKPEDVGSTEGAVMAGNVFAVYAARLPDGPGLRLTALPTASAMLRLAPALLASGAAVSAEHALPTYVRDKVAQTTLERAALKQGEALR
ncbi:tRNA threonylcarbamoyladenosine biosynthesis protein TsaB [mine drainage metagenome]|uniref:tRNA threonylcarbamoyladenosine biosynthesis protein TsaB n=1 Tax=mine drainage metagenome TaxID=410659 RepID=A0A1J5QYQ5_9ZZZZ